MRISLGGGKVEQPQPFSAVLNNVAQFVLCAIKALRCSQPIKRSRLGVILRKSSSTKTMQPTERVLTITAAPP